jgi:hypothetical protein
MEGLQSSVGIHVVGDRREACLADLGQRDFLRDASAGGGLRSATASAAISALDDIGQVGTHKHPAPLASRRTRLSLVGVGTDIVEADLVERCDYFVHGSAHAGCCTCVPAGPAATPLALPECGQARGRRLLAGPVDGWCGMVGATKWADVVEAGFIELADDAGLTDRAGSTRCRWYSIASWRLTDLRPHPVSCLSPHTTRANDRACP